MYFYLGGGMSEVAVGESRWRWVAVRGRWLESVVVVGSGSRVSGGGSVGGEEQKWNDDDDDDDDNDDNDDNGYHIKHSNIFLDILQRSIWL